MYYLEKDMTEALRTVTLGLADIVKDYEVPAGAVQQRAGPAPARGRKRPSPPPRPGLARPQGRGHHVDGGAGVRVRRLRQTIGSGAGRVDVEAEHLLDDYWWVTATPAGTDPNNAAMAVVRIQGQQRPPAPRGGLLGPHLLTGRRGEPLGTTDRSRWLPRPGGR